MNLWKKTLFIILSVSLLQTVYVWAQDFNEQDVIVAVLDTGVDANHVLLKNKVIKGFDFVDQDFDASDDSGHGTHVAGIIAMQAPGAKIMPIRIIEGNTIYSPHLAILYAVWNGADIINMSFVAEPYSILTEKAIQYGRSEGVVFVASSGNQGVSKAYYPAKYNGVLSVSALDPGKDTIFGNYGEDVRYVAPGINILSADINGGMIEKTGTSMSSAYMSGVIAYIKLKYPEIDDEGMTRLLDNASNSIEFIGASENESETTDHRLYKAVEMDRVKRQLNEDIAFGLIP
jgi:subtilisin family serine protease